MTVGNLITKKRLKTENHEEDFHNKALQARGEVVKLTPGSAKSINLFNTTDKK